MTPPNSTLGPVVGADALEPVTGGTDGPADAEADAGIGAMGALGWRNIWRHGVLLSRVPAAVTFGMVPAPAPDTDADPDAPLTLLMTLPSDMEG